MALNLVHYNGNSRAVRVGTCTVVCALESSSAVKSLSLKY